MAFDLDIVIFVIFVVVTLVVGILSSRGVTNISQYALGGRNFSTMALSATIIATWISGGLFSYSLSETYKNGLHFIIPLLGDFFVFVIIGYVLVPRMGEFLGKLSIAEAIGSLYGKNSRLIIAVIGIFVCAGITAIQFKVSSTLMGLLFGINSFDATLISAVVVIFYSTFGGIRAVTFTDILQFLVFAVVIPIVTFTIWQSFNDYNLVFKIISDNPMFDYKNVFDYQHPRFFSNISLLFYFMLPRLNPALFQRVSMAKNINQATKAFLIAGIFCILIDLLICWTGVLLFTVDSSLDPKNLFSSLVNNYSITGFKGFVIAGVMAMIMSSSDSYINSSSVMFSHDFCRYFKFIKIKDELLVSKIFSCCVGIFAFILALNSKTILGLLMMTMGFYNSVLTIPFLLAIFGFRSSSKSFFIAAMSGVIVSLVWQIYFKNSTIDSAIPGMFANLVALFGSHYLLKQPGGWVGLKDGGRFAKLKKEKKYKWQKRINKIKNFNFVEFCYKNKPESEATYPLFALFSIAAIYSGMFTIEETVRSMHADILDKFFHSVIILSSMFLTCPMWPASLKSNKFIGVAWNFSLFYILIVVSSFQVIISDFDSFQAMILMMNIIILGLLSRWYVALFMTIIGVIISVQFFKLYMGVDSLPGNMGSLQFQLVYTLLLSSSALLVFVKPDQEEFEISKEKNVYFNQKIADMESEIKKNENIKSEFLYNLPILSDMPLVKIDSLIRFLDKNFDKLSRESIYKYLLEIDNSGDELKAYIDNLTDLSKLTIGNYQLNLENVNLGELVYKRVKFCQKIYLNEEKKESLQFYLDIEDNIVFPCDKRYMTKVIDNIIINAIQYTDDGEININLTKDYKTNKILFTVSDQGMGIPKNELYDIFAAFTIGSKNKSVITGKGIGLAVVKEIVKLHKGKVSAESEENKGATFFVEFNT
ncbi:MAG: hypothetical protein HRU35_04095 [Rickettsiaceae bacterium]|nr:hypothetical protein [Rickettsiaceae bacterium]